MYLASRTYEAAGVVVAHCLGVSEGLQQRVGLEDDVLDVLDSLPASGDAGDVLHDELGGHRLSGARLAAATGTNGAEAVTGM